MHDYIPFLAFGVVIWGFLSQIIIEGCDTFVNSSGLIKQSNLPMLAFLFRTTARNLLVFAHQLIILVIVLIYFNVWRTVNIPWMVLGFLLSTLNVMWIGLLFGLVSSRFRDVPQIVTSVLQVLLFLTPVFWTPESISAHRYILSANPLYHMLQAVRQPALGKVPPYDSYLILAAMLVCGLVVAFIAFSQTRRRVVHYL